MTTETATPYDSAPNGSAPAGRPANAAPGGKAASAPLLGHEEEPTIFDFSVPGRRSASFRTTGVPEWTAEELLPPGELRPEPPAVAEISERDLVGHMTRLSHRQYSVDLGAYPLGSCTMKYNPKLCDEAAALPGLSQVHPATPARLRPGMVGAALEAERCALSRHGHARGHAAAASGRLRGTDRAPFDASLARPAGAHPNQGPHPGLGSRDQPGVSQLGWFHYGQRALRPPRPGEHRRVAPAPRRRRGRDHAHQPEHHWPVRGGHRRAGARPSTRRAAFSTTTGPT